MATALSVFLKRVPNPHRRSLQIPIAAALAIALRMPAAEIVAAAAGEPLPVALERAVAQTLEQMRGVSLRADQFAATVIDLGQPGSAYPRASHRGDVQVYPASVVKLFYLVAAHHWLETGKIAETDEVRRAMKDMIVDSGNEATHYLIDVMTETTSGPELSDAALAEWYEKRNAINRYFSSAGYTNINANRKPWCEGPYGREIQSVRRHAPNHRNWLTTDATARLLAEIATGKAVSARRSAQMMELLKRDPFTREKPNRQAIDFLGSALPAGARLWSKAGWTSETRHDAAYIELPEGKKLVLVVFTVGHAQAKEILPAFARHFFAAYRGAP